MPPRLPSVVPSPSLAATVERMAEHLEKLLFDVRALRDENKRLRGEVEEMRHMFARVDEVLSSGRLAPGSSGGRHRESDRGGSSHKVLRVTPEVVTEEVVRAVIGRLGSPTAAEIAGEITKAGTQVSGRAIRFLAERAGASVSVGDDGRRRYHV